MIAADTPNGDEVLFGIAANMEELASEPHPPKTAAQEARLLYRRVAEMFPQSKYAGQAAWRAADIGWQLQKEDVFSLPSAHEKENYLREQIDETEMKKIEKKYPGTKWADLAAYDMLDNKICGDWQGSEKCPEKESELYLKYADDHPDSPKAAEALYKAAWRRRRRRICIPPTTRTRNPSKRAPAPKTWRRGCRPSTRSRITRRARPVWYTNWSRVFLSTASTASK